MADYQIVGAIVVNDASAPGAMSAQKNLEAVERKATAVGGSIMGSLGRAFAFLGGTALLGGAARGLIELNSVAQDTRVGIAAIFNSQAGLSMADSFKLATQQLGVLRQAAAEGQGELDDYTDAFSKLFSPLRTAGADLNQINTLIPQIVAAGGLEGRGSEGMRLAAFDVQQGFTSGASERITPILAKILRGVNVTTDAFNGMSREAKLETLTRGLAKLQPAIEELGKTWSAQSSTFRDNLKEIARTVTEPLFDRWTGSLQAANRWIKDHRETVTDIAETWGARLLRIWDHVLDNARSYLTLLTAAAAIQAAPAVIGGARGAASGLASAGGAAMGAARAGFAGVSLRDPFGMAAIFGGNLLGAGGGAGGGILAGLRGLAGAAARVAGPVALVTAGFMAVQGALAEFPQALAFIAAAGRYVVESFSALGTAFGSLTAEGSALNLVGGALLTTLGGLGFILGGAARAVGVFAVGIGTMLQIIGDGFKAIYLVSTGQFAEAAKISVMDRLTAANDQIGAILFGDQSGNNGIQGEQTNAAGLTAADLAKKKGGDTIINGDVNLNLKTEQNADPARVMVAWEEGADRLRRFPQQAKRLPSLPT